MKKGIRTVVYDEELRIEACRFEGIEQPFPSHFHGYYVIGSVEEGERVLSCKGRDYTIGRGSILLLEPGDDHACVQSDGGTLDYRALNISEEVMLDLAEEIAGRRELPGFSRNAVFDEEASRCLRQFHERVMDGRCGPGREEGLRQLLSLLLQRYGRPLGDRAPACGGAVERACAFMEQHYAERICLDRICRCAGLSRSGLLRAFVRAKGVTPYSYLESVRIGRAKELLEQGVPPVEAALRAGFSDQSHFTNYFDRFIGLTPGAYRDMFLGKDAGETARGE